MTGQIWDVESERFVENWRQRAFFHMRLLLDHLLPIEHHVDFDVGIC